MASSPGDWYQSLPPVCKAWGTACMASAVASQLGMIDLSMFHWSLPLVIKKFQIWRLVTNFCFLGRFSFPFVVRMMMMCVPSRPVPSRPERRRPTASATGTDDVGPSIPEIYLFLTSHVWSRASFVHPSIGFNI